MIFETYLQENGINTTNPELIGLAYLDYLEAKEDNNND